MFKCQLCKIQSRPGDKAVRVVLEMRPVEYPKRKEAHRAVGRDFRTGKRVRKDDPGGKGWEIVREAIAHKQCAMQYAADLIAATNTN